MENNAPKMSSGLAIARLALGIIAAVIALVGAVCSKHAAKDVSIVGVVYYSNVLRDMSAIGRPCRREWRGEGMRRSGPFLRISWRLAIHNLKMTQKIAICELFWSRFLRGRECTVI